MLDKQLKSLSSSNLRTAVARLSVAPHRAELFLERFVNLDPKNERRRKAFFEAFADLLPNSGLPPHTVELLRLPGDHEWKEPEASMQVWLQRIWTEQSAMLKEAKLMLLASYEQTFLAESAIEQGEYERFTPFVGVLRYALKNAHLLHFCANSTCKEPYFVARRGSQIYCSPACAKPAQREAKLKWWNEQGINRRKKFSGSSKRRREGA